MTETQPAADAQVQRPKRVSATTAATWLFWPYLIATVAAVLWATASNVYSGSREIAYLVSGIFPLFSSLVGFLVGDQPSKRSVPTQQVTIVVAVSSAYLLLLVAVPWIIGMQLGTEPNLGPTGDASTSFAASAGSGATSALAESQSVADRSLDDAWTVLGVFMAAVVAAHARLIGQQKKDAA